MNNSPRARGLGLVAAVALAIAVAACTGPTADESRTVELTPLNGSGVSGSVRLSPVEAGRTLVEIEVDPAGHPDMPAHIHPGTCAELTPQPAYPLANVIDGRSSTEVPASLDELLAGELAVNLHLSNMELDVYSACVDL